MLVFSAPANLAVMTDRQLHTRTLAASCAACHSTQQHGVALSNVPYMPLFGMDKTFFISQLQAFKNGERASMVMHRHAKGLNAQEVSDLADYFAAQKLNKTQALPQQKLFKTHPH